MRRQQYKNTETSGWPDLLLQGIAHSHCLALSASDAPPSPRTLLSLKHANTIFSARVSFRISLFQCCNSAIIPLRTLLR